jgi:hypothetical protein
MLLVFSTNLVELKKVWLARIWLWHLFSDERIIEDAIFKKYWVAVFFKKKIALDTSDFWTPAD